MKHQISLDNSLNSCPICDDKHNQIKGRELKTTHQIIDKVFIEIKNPAKHYLQTCEKCNVSYKSNFPSIKTESYLTDIWKTNSSSRYQDKTSKKLKKIAKYITNLSKSKKIKVLDIGIGEGSYLDIIAGEQNIEIYIMDCDQKVLDRVGDKINAKKILADIGKQNEIEDYHHKFDVITAFDLIEHIPSSFFIENINLLLKKDGTFLAETGNKDNLFCKIFGLENWWYFNIIEHKVFWSKKALYQKLISSGFVDIKIKNAIHKDRRLINLSKDFIKSIMWLIKIAFLRKNIIVERNPKFPIRDQLFVKAKK